MKTIWKFGIPVKDYFELDLPEGATILHVDCQNDQPQIWAMVKTGTPLQRRFFRLYGTGHQMGEEYQNHIGSFQMAGGSLVFHLFETRI
jgi:hypothetical protein